MESRPKSCLKIPRNPCETEEQFMGFASIELAASRFRLKRVEYPVVHLLYIVFSAAAVWLCVARV